MSAAAQRNISSVTRLVGTGVRDSAQIFGLLVVTRGRKCVCYAEYFILRLNVCISHKDCLTIVEIDDGFDVFRLL